MAPGGYSTVQLLYNGYVRPFARTHEALSPKTKNMTQHSTADIQATSPRAADTQDKPTTTSAAADSKVTTTTTINVRNKSPKKQKKQKREITPPSIPTSISKNVGTRCRSLSYELMQFTFHATRRTPHGASRLVQAMSAWLVKTRCAPPRHSRYARVYGHTTTAMHKLSTPPPIPPPY